MILPSKSPITLAFGSTDSPYGPGFPHEGVDFSYVPDNIIYAPFTGTVTLVANNGRDGNAVYMTDSKGRLHGLLHASKFLVPNVSKVQEGQPIAVMGFSGYVVPAGPLGTHLHWCVKESGVFIDPLSLVKESDMDKDKTIADLTKQRDDVAEKLIAAEKLVEAVTKQRDDVALKLIDTEKLLEKAQQGGAATPDQVLGGQLVELIRKVS